MPSFTSILEQCYIGIQSRKIWLNCFTLVHVPLFPLTSSTKTYQQFQVMMSHTGVSYR